MSHDLTLQTSMEFDRRQRTKTRCPFCRDHMLEVPNCFDEDKQPSILEYCPRCNKFIK